MKVNGYSNQDLPLPCNTTPNCGIYYVLLKPLIGNLVRHILIIISIFLFSFTIISCGSDDGGSSASTDNTSSTTTSDDDSTTSDNNTTTTDTPAPVIAEVTAVVTPTQDITPNYIFSSDEAGTITYGGSCSSSTTSAVSGNNTITLVSLSDGTHSDCTITVIDGTGNVSSSLSKELFFTLAGISVH